MEKLNWGAPTGKAKVIGTIVGLAGALLLTFYKGVEVDIWPFQINLLEPKDNQIGHVTDTTSELLGVLCAVISCFCFSTWLIIQVFNWLLQSIVLLFIAILIYMPLNAG